MTFTDIAIASGVGTTVVVAFFGVLIWFFRSYLGSYLAKKAENLATKQDIQDLTRLQEEVKAEFEQILERQRTEAQLRLAVVERRFQAHQDAHTLWLKLFQKVYVGEIGEVVMECQEWWEKNSLYLESKTRIAFKLAYHAALNHRDLLKGPRDDDHKKIIEQNWRQIIEAGSMIEDAVNLPSLGVSEVQRVGEPELTAWGDGE